MEIEWEDPPERAIARAHGGRYAELAVVLREHPQRWAVLPSLDGKERTEKGAAGTAQNIRRGVVKGFEPKGSFETAVDGTKVWVRFVGTPDDEKVPETESPPPEPEQQADEDDTEPPDAIAPAKAVRSWAKAHGLEVPDRGRLPEDLFRKYAQAVNAGEVGLPVRSLRVARDQPEE